MNVTIELNALQCKQYDEELLTYIAEDVITTSDVIKRDNMHITMSIAIVDEDEMRRINKKLRSVDAITDVISVGDYSDDNDISISQDDEVFLGEVILCYNDIERFARENNCDVNREFFIVYSHGILHLLGFEHGEKMFHIQDKVGAKFASSFSNN